MCERGWREGEGERERERERGRGREREQRARDKKAGEKVREMECAREEGESGSVKWTETHRGREIDQEKQRVQRRGENKRVGNGERNKERARERAGEPNEQ